MAFLENAAAALLSLGYGADIFVYISNGDQGKSLLQSLSLGFITPFKESSCLKNPPSRCFDLFQIKKLKVFENQHC